MVVHVLNRPVLVASSALTVRVGADVHEAIQHVCWIRAHRQLLWGEGALHLACAESLGQGSNNSLCDSSDRPFHLTPMKRAGRTWFGRLDVGTAKQGSAFLSTLQRC